MKRDILAKPRYIPVAREKMLAVVDQAAGLLLLETGRAIAYTPDTFVSLVIEHNLLCFISSLASFKLLPDFVEHGKVIISKEQLPIYMSRRGRHVKHAGCAVVVESSVWGYAYATLTMLHHLRALFDHCFVGVHPTPGALGYALYCQCQYEHYGKEWRQHRHIRSAAGASEFLEEHKRGARIETFVDAFEEFDEIDELDISSAYLDWYRVQPCGKSIYFMFGDVDEFQWYEANCTVTLYEEFSYGLVGSKHINDEEFDEMVFIRFPGDYRMVLGKLEVDLLREAGCDVEVEDGYGWYEITRDPEYFVERMELLRNTAPTPPVRTLVKKVGLAAIGRDGMSQEIMLLVPESKRADGDVPLVDDKRHVVYNWFIHADIDNAPKSMPHWYAHTTERGRVNMTRLMYKFPGRVCAINTDGLYVRTCALSRSFPMKQEIIKTGEITRETHYGVKFPDTGHVDARSGKQRHPGGARKKRKKEYATKPH